ncbi:MAG: uroporphyrinogen-III synthase [Alphaproteobacteria bacterium]|nr:uroporphyrinogen-III synthase [Alphaproteobacteria bacterium]
MSNMRRTILLIRPEQDSRALQPLIEAMGYKVMIAPILDIVPLQNPLPNLSQIDALIFTSANAVRVFGARSDERNLEVFVVGNNTAAEAQKQGFQNIQNANGAVQDLAQLLNRHTELRFLYVRAKDIGQNLLTLCPRLEITEHIAYEARKASELSAQTIDALKSGQITAIPFFSKRTGEHFVDIISSHSDQKDIFNGLQRTKALCLAQAMIECVQQVPWQNIEVAKVLNRQGMLDLLQNIEN